MPTFDFHCPQCKEVAEDVLLAKAKPAVKCPRCGKGMKRIFSTRQTSGTKSFWSIAMGVNPSQTGEANRRFPHEHFRKDGRMLINGYAHAKKVMKDFGTPLE